MIAVKSLFRWALCCLLFFGKKTFGSTSKFSENENSVPFPFSCAGKVIGGYYADLQNNCRMFHVCTIGENGEIRDFVFKCLNGTVFDQETRVCEREAEVDCAKSESFFALNDDLYGPGVIPDTAYDFRRDHRQTYRQKLPDHLTMEDTSSNCKSMTNAIFFSQPQYRCKFYYLCIPQYSLSELLLPFICMDEDHIFDHQTGQCVHKKTSIDCNAETQTHKISIKEAETLAVYTLGICSILKKQSLIADPLSGCQQYFQCPVEKDHPITVRRCPDGLLFSYELQRCTQALNVACSKETYSLFKYMEIRTTNSPAYKNWFNAVDRLQNIRVSPGLRTVPLFLRFKRGLDFESDHHSIQKDTYSSLSELATVFHRQSSVVESPKTGNVITSNGNREFFGTTLDNYGATTTDQNIARDHIKRILHTSRMSHSLQPETSLELNKQTLNGTVIEVSEIVSPNKKGKVTITSVVPKIVNQNGNGGTANKRTSALTPTAVTNGGTKITLIGANSPDPFATQDELKTDAEGASNVTISDSDLVDSENSTQIEFNADVSSSFINENLTLQLEGNDTGLAEANEGITTEIPLIDITTTFPSDEFLTVHTINLSSTSVSTSTAPSSTSAKTVGFEQETGSSVEPGSVQTNFTCKDKELEQFYPDIESDCRLFHYCSPGFTDDEVLDLTFKCSGDTKFDLKTKKCQDMSTVICGEETLPNTTVSSTTQSTTTTSSTTQSTTTTSSTTVASSSTIPSITKSVEISKESTTTPVAENTEFSPALILNTTSLRHALDNLSTLNNTDTTLTESTSDTPQIFTTSEIETASTDKIFKTDAEAIGTDTSFLGRSENLTEVLEDEITTSFISTTADLKVNETEQDISTESVTTELFLSDQPSTTMLNITESLNGTELPVTEIFTDPTSDNNDTTNLSTEATTTLTHQELELDEEIHATHSLNLGDITDPVTFPETSTIELKESTIGINTTESADIPETSSPITPLIINNKNDSILTSTQDIFVNTTTVENL